jgi:hypothetical protein
LKAYNTAKQNEAFQATDLAFINYLKYSLSASHQFKYDEAYWSQNAFCLETKLRANWFAIICLIDSLENLSCDISFDDKFFSPHLLHCKATGGV